MTAKKKPEGNRVVTKIEGDRVKMRRPDWETFVAETDKVLGLELHDVGKGKGTVTIDLEVWSFLLAVLKSATEYSGASARGGGGCESCCEEECAKFGGCDFCYGTVGVCNQGDLVLCNGAA